MSGASYLNGLVCLRTTVRRHVVNHVIRRALDAIVKGLRPLRRLIQPPHKDDIEASHQLGSGNAEEQARARMRVEELREKATDASERIAEKD